MFEADKLWEAIIAVLLATAGGMARLLNKKGESKLKISRIISELFISGFIGYMVLLIARYFGLSSDLIGVVAGMSGWSGPKVLDVLGRLVKDHTGIDVNAKKDKGDNENEL